MSLLRIRFTVQRIMLAVLLSGFALAALRGPSPTWTVASFHLAIVLLSVAPIVAGRVGMRAGSSGPPSQPPVGSACCFGG